MSDENIQYTITSGKIKKLKGFSTYNCSRCNSILGSLKYDPKPYWGYNGKICMNCNSSMKKNRISLECEYIEGTLGYKKDTEVDLELQNYDEGSIAIVAKDDFTRFPVTTLKSFKIIEREEESITKKIVTVGFKNKNKIKLLELDFADGTSNHKIFLKLKNVEDSIDNISELVELSKKRETTIDEHVDGHSFIMKYGKVIRHTPSAQYYGGHKAYLAGGNFSDAQNGQLFLTENYLVFIKNAFRESKRWRIEIPLRSIIIDDWTIDEKVRRQTVRGGMIPFGFLFGGGGLIHDSGKAHDIVIPYVDENGITQKPRFGVPSLSGNAIREWARIIYDQLVKIKKENTTSVIQEEQVTQSDNDPLTILKMRLARGEITKKEFDEIRETLDKS